jgi:hypothetical protein
MAVDVVAVREQSSPSTPPAAAAAGGVTNVLLCECEDVATVNCTDCDKVFCDECNACTHRKGARKEHARMPIDEHTYAGRLSTVSGRNNHEQEVKCPLHPTYPIIFFCNDEDCGVAICALCVAESHAHHLYTKISEAFGTATAELDAAIEAAVPPLSAAEAGKVAVKEQVGKVEAIGAATIQQIETNFRSFQTCVVARKNVLKEMVTAEVNRKTALLRAQHYQLEQAHDCLQNGLEVAVRFKAGRSVSPTFASSLCSSHDMVGRPRVLLSQHERTSSHTSFLSRVATSCFIRLLTCTPPFHFVANQLHRLVLPPLSCCRCKNCFEPGWLQRRITRWQCKAIVFWFARFAT